MAAVETDAASVLASEARVVDVVVSCLVYVIRRAVVVELTPVPTSSVIPLAGVSEPIVNAAIEANLGAPIAFVKAISVVLPGPIAGCP